MKQKIVAESLGLFSTALGLVAALAWNEAVKALIQEFLPKEQGTVSLFVYAAVVTAIGVIVASHLMKLKSRFDDQ